MHSLPIIAYHIERCVRTIGWVAAWLNVVLVITILVQVILRYLVSGGHQVLLGELEWHLYATAVLFGVSYSQVFNTHVRVDALSRNFSPRTRAVIEILGILLLMYPFLIIMFLQGVDYVAVAWRVNEGSSSPVGLPWRWLIKAVLPAAFLLLFAALTARVLREIAFLCGVETVAKYADHFMTREHGTGRPESPEARISE